MITHMRQCTYEGGFIPVCKWGRYKATVVRYTDTETATSDIKEINCKDCIRRLSDEVLIMFGTKEQLKIKKEK